MTTCNPPTWSIADIDRHIAELRSKPHLTPVEVVDKLQRLKFDTSIHLEPETQAYLTQRLRYMLTNLRNR